MSSIDQTLIKAACVFFVTGMVASAAIKISENLAPKPIENIGEVPASIRYIQETVRGDSGVDETYFLLQTRALNCKAHACNPSEWKNTRDFWVALSDEEYQQYIDYKNQKDTSK